ncbi:glycosyl hydrolase [Anaerolineales bacterium HSG6]|nr:glycosyl hydrolase [Anaerolineales bacterium HSG6]
MSKIMSFFLVIFSVSMVLFFGYITLVSAQPISEENKFTKPSEQRWNDVNNLSLINTNAYTVYLPITVKSYINPKKGLAVKAPPACDDMNTLRASWYLNWAPWPDDTCGDAGKAKFVPLIATADGMQYLSGAIEYAKVSGWLIGFSEANRPIRGNMSPEQGAELWKQIENVADVANVKLVSPTPYEPNPEEGNQWLWLMVDAYRNKYGHDPRFDAISWNIYGCTNNPNCYDINGMKNFLTDRHNEAIQRGYNVPIWVLEYGGCLTDNSGESDKAVMQEITQWFNDTDWISRYAWYSNRRASSYQGDHKCILIDDNGSLTELGRIYQSY